jgi:DNA-directed RNA polymerase subunit RPC12/RpoP
MINEKPTNGPGQNLNISLKDARDIPCECGNTIFMPGYRFKKISRLLTGAAKDSILPIELYLCTSCGKPLKELMPEELKSGTTNETKPSITTDLNG